MQYNIPSDSVATIPLVFNDEEGKPRAGGKGWKVSSSDACVKAEIIREHGHTVLKLTPTADKGTSHVVYEREDVRDTLDVAIVGAAVKRVAFDVHNAKQHAMDDAEDEPAKEVAPHPEARDPVKTEADRQDADRASDQAKTDMAADRTGTRVVK